MIFLHPPLRCASPTASGAAQIYAIGSLLARAVRLPGFSLMQHRRHAHHDLRDDDRPFGIIYAICYGPEAALFADLFDAGCANGHLLRLPVLRHLRSGSRR